MNIISRSITTLLIVLTMFFSYAQNGVVKVSEHKDFKKGVRLFKNGNFVKAEEQFQLLLDSGYRDNILLTYQAQVHLELHEPHAAKDVIMLSKKRNQDLDFLLAVAHYYLEEFDEAMKELMLVSDTGSYHVEDMKKRIRNSIKHYHDAKGYVIQNFGPEVNTKFQEYAPVMFHGFDELLFTSRNDTSEYTAHDGMAFEQIHDTSIDSINRWHVADPFEFHTGHEAKHDATVQAYQGGKKLITYHDGRLFKSHLVDNVWEEDGPLAIHDFEHGMDTHCFIADDESFVIFASDFHSYGHDLNLFVSYRKNDSTWSEPEALDELNTLYDEDAPFLAKDSTLYFSSRGHGSLGGYDIFKSTYDKKNKKWSKPVNLDYPINTVSEDIYFSTYGKVAFVSSTRVGGYGSFDLYRILLFNEFMIEGLVKDKKTGEPIPYCQIEIEYDSLYFRTYSNDKGHYEMYVPVNKEMKVKFIQHDEELYSDNYYVDVFFREKDDRIYNFEIPIDKGASKTRGVNPKKKANLIHIEMHNDFDDVKFIKSIAKNEISHWSDSLKNFYEERRLKEYMPGPGKVTVYFNLNSTELDASVTNILNELNKKFKVKKDFTIEIAGHTDPRGSRAYNQKLSVSRAESVAEYLFSLGLGKDNVKVIGYGEDRLIDNSNSESSHAKNRRVEVSFY